jgi:F-box domain
METLPSDIIRHIGSYLDYNDRIRCSETAKCFHSISHTIREHYIRFTEHTYKEKLDNFLRIVRYVKNIKPTLYKLHLEFVNVDILHEVPKNLEDMFEIIPHDIVYVYFVNCSSTTESMILQHLNKVKSTTISRRELSLLDVGYLNDYNIINLESEISDANFHILSQKAVVGCHTLNLSVKLKDMALDLSSIDTNTCVSLCVNIFNNDFVCIDPHKITKLIEWIPGETSDLSKFHMSCMIDPNFQSLSRLQSVYIFESISLVNNTWLHLAKIFPMNVCYVLCVSNPSVFAFIDELREIGVTHFRYFCYCETSFLHAVMCKRISKKYDFNIEKCKYFNSNIREEMFPTVKDVYDAMDVESRQVWKMLVQLVTFREA